MTDFEQAVVRALERIALALERRTGLVAAPASKPAGTSGPCTPGSHDDTPAVEAPSFAAAASAAPVEPAPPSGPPGQPQDRMLEFSQGPFKGKKLSELDEKQLRQLIRGFQSSLQKAVDERNAERKASYMKWVTLILQWADYRGIKPAPTQP